MIKILTITYKTANWYCKTKCHSEQSEESHCLIKPGDSSAQMPQNDIFFVDLMTLLYNSSVFLFCIAVPHLRGCLPFKADWNSCTILLWVFLSEFCKRNCFAIFVFDVCVFQLLTEAFAEVRNIFLTKFLLFCFFCLCKTFFSWFFSKEVYSFNSFIHKNYSFWSQFSFYNIYRYFSVFLMLWYSNTIYHRYTTDISYPIPRKNAKYSQFLYCILNQHDIQYQYYII